MALDLDDAELTPAPQDDRPRADHRTRCGEAETEGLSSPAPRRGGEERDDDAEIEMPAGDGQRRGAPGVQGFDALTPYELAQLNRLMSRLRLATPPRRTRRRVRGRHGGRVNMRRTLRASLRTGGDPVRLARRRRRVVPRRLVMLCDISGSMEPYARAYLQFLSCAARTGPDAEAFAFATRLTRLTARSPRAAPSGRSSAPRSRPRLVERHRIGDVLKTFNDWHGRRGMARGAAVGDHFDCGSAAIPSRAGG